MQVVGIEESKGDDPISPLPLPDSSLLQPSDPSAPHLPHFIPVLEALRQYEILADNARAEGPDYIPCEWTTDLLLQDIPWSQLPLVCALGRPLDFIPTSHILKVRRAFIHCLQAVLDTLHDELVWKRLCLRSAHRPLHQHWQVPPGGPGLQVQPDPRGYLAFSCGAG